MFERFCRRFGVRPATPPGRTWISRDFETASGLAEFQSSFGGIAVASGLYRVHSEPSAKAAEELVRVAYPDFQQPLMLFGYDWLGRQFALDYSEMIDKEPTVLMFEIGTSLALRIPATLQIFHDVELVSDPEACLAESFFFEWSQENKTMLPIESDQCVGYRIPLFLGGVDDISNVELSDISVYWSVLGQIRSQLLGQ